MIHSIEVGRFQRLMAKSKTFQPDGRNSLHIPQWRASRAFWKKKEIYNLPVKEVRERDEKIDEKSKLAHLVVNRNELSMASFSI
jgi:hypothetical protein